MSELLLCNQMMAAMPYYIDEMSVNVYSLEELCYFIENNTCLLTSSFMCTELTFWIENELGEKELAQSLKQMMDTEASLAESIEYLLLWVGYCTKETCGSVMKTLRELEQKPEYECVKLRADWLMEKKKYLSSLYEYQRLLQIEEVKEHPILEGNVWHNMGTAYARLMLFEEAENCYKNAYRLNQDKKSLEACSYAKRIGAVMKDGSEREISADKVWDSDISDMVSLEKLQSIENNGKTAEYYKKIEEIFVRPDIKEVRFLAKVMIENWKSEYLREM